MVSMTLTRDGHDPIITAVLDGIFAASEIDPASITPDEKFGKDLGMTTVQSEAAIAYAAKKLGLPPPAKGTLVVELSARNLVEHFQACAASKKGRAA